MKFNGIEYIKSRFFINVIYVVVMVHTQPIIAEQAEYQFGVGLMAFNYAEYRDNNEFLDGESGFIPGLVLKRKQNHQQVYTELVGQIYSSLIKYDGQTNTGIPLKTDSVAIIMDTHFKLGMTLAKKHEPYIGLGYRYWYRNILNGRTAGGSAVAGLLEEYYWYYGMLGYATNDDVSEKINVGFDIRYTRMFDARMDVNYLGFKAYDNKQVNLGNESGLRFAVPIKFKTRNQSLRSLTVSPYYEIINISKSNLVVLTQSGVPVTGCIPDPCQIYEPRSETRNVGIELTWLW